MDINIIREKEKMTSIQTYEEYGGIDKFREFLVAEKQEMERHKWIESEKAGRDLGREAIYQWVKLYAKIFREKYFELHPINHTEPK